jgi:hypothetical protein
MAELLVGIKPLMKETPLYRVGLLSAGLEEVGFEGDNAGLCHNILNSKCC